MAKSGVEKLKRLYERLSADLLARPKAHKVGHAKLDQMTQKAEALRATADKGAINALRALIEIGSQINDLDATIQEVDNLIDAQGLQIDKLSTSQGVLALKVIGRAITRLVIRSKRSCS